jgi:hypothetical protein
MLGMSGGSGTIPEVNVVVPPPPPLPPSPPAGPPPVPAPPVPQPYDNSWEYRAYQAIGFLNYYHSTNNKYGQRIEFEPIAPEDYTKGAVSADNRKFLEDDNAIKQWFIDAFGKGYLDAREFKINRGPIHTERYNIQFSHVNADFQKLQTQTVYDPLRDKINPTR